MAKMGPPTKYTAELLEKAHKYLEDYNHHDAKFPSHIGLSLYLDIRTETLYTWAKDETKKDITDILAKIKAIQHEMLIGNGLSGDYNSNIAKLVLGKHGYHDKMDSTLANPDGTNLASSDIEIARKLAHVLDKALRTKNDSE